jgi:CubicO group peptidase (beta-lactamase class C family)
MKYRTAEENIAAPPARHRGQARGNAGTGAGDAAHGWTCRRTFEQPRAPRVLLRGAVMTAAALSAAVAAAGERHGIPGIAAALLRGDHTTSASFGTLNVETGVAVTDDSIFQIGSITKVFTATLVMQLVDAGHVEIASPIRRYLPELRIAGEPVSAAITVESLLAHTSGILGDFFIDTGKNADATQRYVERCAELRYLTEPGIFSYCNSGYGILGRLIEVIGGAPWVDQVRGKLLEPLGITALLDPEEAMLHRIAAGHVLTESGAIGLTPTPYLPRSTESIGARLTMSPAALLRFARMHLRDGRAPDGTALLSTRSARRMREVVVGLPIPFHHIAAYGLGWAIRDPRTGVVGHNGGTIGQSAFLLLFPQADTALAVLTNLTSGVTGAAFEDILAAVTAVDGTLALPAAPVADPERGVDAAPLVGRYDTAMSTIDVRRDGAHLVAVVTQQYAGAIARLPDVAYRLEPIDDARFEAVDLRDGSRASVGFTAPRADGTPRFLFWGGRLAERVPA